MLTSVAPPDIGIASGTFSTLRQLGGAFGIAILVAVFAGAGSYASPQAFIDGFAPALGVCASLAALAALADLSLPGRQTRPGYWSQQGRAGARRGDERARVTVRQVPED